MANIEGDNIIYRIFADTKELEAATRRATVATDKLDKSVQNLNKEGQRAADQNKKNTVTYEQAAKKRAQLIKEETQDLRELQDRRKKAYTVKEISAYNKRIKETEGRIKTLRGETGKAGKGFNAFNSIIRQGGAALAGFFALSRIKDFTIESVKLANQSRNVKNAFDQLDNSVRIMDELRRATGGTVDDLTLMQGAIRADKFKVPLEQLGSFFKFATDRAAETGEEVDYLVRSIVDGIGRKSTLVLDNLGISAAELQAEFRKTGDFGQAAANIIEREMANTNVVIDESARATQRLNASWLNFQKTFGDFIADEATYGTDALTLTVGLIAEIIDGGEQLENTLSNLATSGSAALNTQLGRFAILLADAQPKQAELLKTTEEYEQAIINTSIALGEAIDKYGDTNVITLGLQSSLDGLIDAYNKFKEAQKETAEQSEFAGRNLAFLNAEIEKLSKEQADALTTEQEVRNIQVQLNALYKERAELLGQNTESTNKLTEANNRLKASFDALAAAADQSNKIAEEAALDLLQLENRFLEGGEENVGQYEERRFNIQKNALQQRILLFDQESMEYAELQNELLKLFKERDDAEGEIEGAAETRRRERRERELAEEAAARQKRIEGAQLVFNTASQLAGMLGAYQQRLYDADLQALNNQLQQKKISEEQYNIEAARLRREQAEAEKRQATFEAIINTAAAVTSGLKTGPVTAAIYGALGAIQIALIQAEPIPQFAKGVIDIDGPGTATSDSISARLSKGESVMTARETSKHKDVFEAIRANRFDEFAREKYIEPALLTMQMQNSSKGKIANAEKYNDYRLRQAIADNKRVDIRNAREIGKAVAREIGSNRSNFRR